MSPRGSVITAASVLAALAAAPAANAAIAGGLPLKTETRPDLVSASIRDSTDSVWPKHVVYTFDEAVKGDEINAKAFRLEGYDASSKEAAYYATLDLDNPKQVIATFQPNTNLANYTVATVAEDAVENVSANQSNLVNAVALADSGQKVGGGLTTAPDLLGAEVDASYNRLILTFDSKVEPGMVTWTKILYYDAAGNRVSSDGGPFSWVSDGNRTIVAAHFPATDMQSVRQAVRVALEDGAVRAEDDTNEESVRQSLAVLGQDGYTARPDLLAVAPVPNKSAVDFTFDHAVSIDEVKDFEVFRNEERRYLAESATVLQDDAHAGRTVRAFFPNEAIAILNELAVASVDDHAVVGTGGPGYHNTIGSKLIGAAKAVKGFTSAPDVSAVAFDWDDGTATLEVDQPALVVNKDAISIVDRFGNEHPAAPLEVVLQGGNKIILQIGSGMAKEAVGVTLENGALAHRYAGDLSVRQAIGRADAVGSPGSGPFDPPVAPGSPAAPAKPAAPAAPKPATQVAGVGAKAAKLVATGRLIRGKRGATAVRITVRGNATRARVRVRMLGRSGKQIASRIVSVRVGKTLTMRQGLPKATRTIKLTVL
ncbi:MAG TPA: hypothetical protein VD931_14060 [Baekduia sp.]|nr:hypothetical protein [Baekduia sp.]